MGTRFGGVAFPRSGILNSRELVHQDSSVPNDGGRARSTNSVRRRQQESSLLPENQPIGAKHGNSNDARAAREKVWNSVVSYRLANPPAVSPPSSVYTCPVAKAASSDAK